MGSLSALLLASSNTLTAQSKGLEIAGKNLANASNPAYARQRVQLGSRGVIPTPTGVEAMPVEVLGVQQVRDILLDRQIVREKGLTAGLGASQTILLRAETALGERIDRSGDSSSIRDTQGGQGSGLSQLVSEFFNSWESVATKPNDSGEKQLLLQKAAILVEEFNLADSRLTQLQDDVNVQIDADLAAANDVLNRIAALNTAIGRAEIGRPGTALDLRDERQAKLEELAQYFDFTTANIGVGGSSSQIQVIAGGVNLLNATGAAVLNPLTVDATYSVFSGGNPVVPLNFQTGRLDAQRDTRDGEIQNMRNQLADVAAQLTVSVNTQYGPPNFFNSPPGSGIIELNGAIISANLKTTNTANPGANEVALGVAGLVTQTFSTGGGDIIDGTISGYLSSSLGELALAVSSSTRRLEDQELSQKLLIDNRDSISGVSQDEELADLLRFERSYQAAARFLNAIDTLLDTVVNRLGNF